MNSATFWFDGGSLLVERTEPGWVELLVTTLTSPEAQNPILHCRVPLADCSVGDAIFPWVAGQAILKLGPVSCPLAGPEEAALAERVLHPGMIQ